MNNLKYHSKIPNANDALELYKLSDILSEYWDLSRMEKVLNHSSLLLCCYDREKLVGIARGISDQYWIAHISHLAVHPDYQGQEREKNLIKKLKDDLGDGVALMVHAGPGADGFYKNLGFEQYEDVYRIKRIE